MLDVSELNVKYGLSQILYDIHLFVKQGDIVTLLGRNGMGKTTILRSIMGLTRPYKATIQFHNQTISGLPSWQIARLGIGYVPEGRQIFPNLTVKENLVATANQRHANRWQEQQIYDLFPRLEERVNHMGNQLSGGEQQMLAIGRALLTNPKLLILDEATEGLAPLIRQEIWQCLETLKSMGQSILIVDKNIKDLMSIANTHFVVEKGRIVWQGDSENIKQNQEFIRKFLAI